MKPITPSEVAKLKAQVMPDAVIEAFNEVIARNWNGSQATVKQNEAIDAIRRKMPDVTRDQVFKNHWLDVEPVFRNAGWRVEYDKPGFNESYEAFFVFKPGKRAVV